MTNDEDVIGHVVEKDVMKEKDVNGRRSKLIDITLQDSESQRIHCTLWANYAERMSSYLATHDSSSPVVVVLQLCKLKRYCGAMGVSNALYGTNLILDGNLPHVVDYKTSIDGADVQVTQGVSQPTSSNVVSLADDLLQSRVMTIEDLIEASDQGCRVVHATIIGIESEYSWYYQACTKCAGRVKSVAGRLFYPKCNTGRNAVPRCRYANLLHNWRNYVVKRTTDDADIIKRFKILHNIKIYEEEEADRHDVMLAIGENVTPEKRLIEDGGLSKTAFTLHDDDLLICTSATDGEVTPSSKIVGKRSAEDANGPKDASGAGDVSVTKPVKLKAVKIEPRD